ncbi:MAG: beta-propeller domain-containing protein, partial [Actinocatenispora sp.]
SGPDAPDAPDTSDVPGRSVPPARPLTGPQLSLVDISGTPRLLGRLTVDGGYVDARQVGRTARIVVSSVPHLDFPPPRAGESASDLTARNRRIVQHSTVQDWLPRYRLERDGRSTDGRVPCPAVEHPAEYSATAMLTVLTVDLKRALDDGSPLTVVGDGQSVYATGHSLYVAGVRQPAGPEIRGRYRPATDIRQFDISGTARPRYLAGGTVPGSLLNQYSMSEYQGRLRVAVTDGVGEDMASTVHVLARDGTTLRTRGSVGGLGHGERIMAVRFLGPVGYVVTFRQTDPLYTIDLSDPAHPRTVGELHLTGYSSYLHPVGANRLIGIGQDATKAGQTTGLLVSLFDVDEPAAPRRVASYHLPGGYTAAEFDPHAFLYWPETGLLVVPVQPTGVVADPSGSSPAREQQPGALVLRVRGDSLARLGMVRHPADRLMPWDPIQRSLVVGTTLWTVSSAGLLATDQESLSRQAWLPVA